MLQSCWMEEEEEVQKKYGRIAMEEKGRVKRKGQI